MPHGTGPTSGHAGRGGIPVLQDFERVNQLCLKELGAPPVVGQGRQRSDHRVIAAERPVGGLEPPNRHDDLFVDTVMRFDTVERRTVFAQRRFAVFDARRRRCAAEVVPDRFGEL